MTNQRPLRGTAATRIELLDIGLELLAEEGLPLGLDIKVADVVKRAGRSLGSAYQIWDNQQQFREELALYLANSVEHILSDVIIGQLKDLMAQGTSIHELARVAGAAYFEIYVAAPDTFVSRHFWTVSKPLPPDIEKALGASALQIQRDWEDLFSMVLDFYSLQPLAPYTLRSLTRMIVAMAQGFTLESRFPTEADTETTHRDLFIESLLLFLDRCTEPTPIPGATP